MLRGNKQRRVLDHLAQMLTRHLKTYAFKDLNDDEVARRLGISKSIFNTPWWADVPDICEAANVDIGLIIRDAKGNEVTLWPADNFASGAKPIGCARKAIDSRVIGFRSEEGKGNQ